MGAAQIILLVYFGVSLLISANQHGKKRPEHNFWVDLLSIGILFGLLIWGGFF